MSTDAIFPRKDGFESEIRQLVQERSAPASELADSTTTREYDQLLGILGIILVAIILGLSVYWAVVYLL